MRTLRGPLARDSLRLGVLRLPTAEQRVAWLVAHLGSLEGSGIVYALTVSAAEDLAAVLRDAGHDVRAYTGRTDPADRQELEEALRDNRVKALIATSALGMGFDKPDLGFVVHVGAPSSPIAYYQQVGRAGRATERADVLLLPGHEDRDIWRYFASASMPRQEQADAVLAALAGAPKPLSTARLETVVDVRRTRLEPAAEGARRRRRRPARDRRLDVDGAPWSYDAERYDRVSAAREREQQPWWGTRPPRAVAWPTCSRRWTTTPRSRAVAATGAPVPGTRATCRRTRRTGPVRGCAGPAPRSTLARSGRAACRGWASR
ncbi:hypothetical protein GCM10025868_44450 [Angustibacter aerolatus]|uniref:DNA 3'-5' helicase n=1 Tax=Angustibacter aerolatus TaxID=1162965 RepID=A0ABQ6JPK5_9ACTN|nr:hypothetical protein GCM10025868_44450 [Angustibacter aerolatus]